MIYKKLNSKENKQLYKRYKYAYGGNPYGEGPTFREKTESSQDLTMSVGSTANPIVGAIIGAGMGIGRNVRTGAEQTDENGNLNHQNRAQGTAIVGGLFSPSTALQTRSSYKGGFTDISGKGYTNALEAEAMDNAKKKKAWEIEQGQEALRSQIAGGYSQKGYDGVLYRKYGGSLYKYGTPLFKDGGKLTPEFEVENKEVITNTIGFFKSLPCSFKAPKNSCSNSACGTAREILKDRLYESTLSLAGLVGSSNKVSATS